MRRGGAAGLWLLGGWFAGSLLLIGPALAWHIEYFRSPGPQFYRLALVAAPALFAMSLVYGWWRPAVLRRAEPWLLTGLLLGAALAWRPFETVVMLALLCASVAAGRRLLELAGFDDPPPLEKTALSAGVGFGLLIPMLMLAPPRIGYFAWVLGSLALCGGALRKSVQEIVWILQAWSSSPELDHPLAGAAAFFALPFASIVLALALAPAIAHDAMMLHLPAALHYVAAGGLEPLPHLSYTYFPQGGELLMATVASIAGQAGAQLVQPVFFALTVVALSSLAARAGASPLARCVGLVFAAGLPFLIWTGGVAKNDMAMTSFQTLALLCLLASDGERSKQWLRLGVFFVAASFSIKYTAAFGAAPLGLLYLWRLWGSKQKWRELLLWAGILAGIAGVWQLRAYWLTGNPVYPVNLSWAFESLRPNAMRPAEWRSIPYWKIPWTIHFDGTVAFESPSPNPSGFFLWLFAPLWLLLRRSRANTVEKACLVFAWIYFFYWGSVWPVVRYAIVPMGLLVVLTAQRLEGAWRTLPGAWRPALAALLCLNGTACMLAAMIFSLNAPQVALFTGRIGEDEYLRRTLVTYPVLERLARDYSPGDWTLSVGVTSAAYAPDPSRFHCEFLVDAAEARSAVPELLAERAYRYLVTPASAEGAAIVRDLPRGVRRERLFEDAHFALDRLDYSLPLAEQ